MNASRPPPQEAAMTDIVRYIGQGLTWIAMGLVIAYFSNAPSYTHLAADQALIKLSFVHGANRVGECRRRTAEELAKLAPNMRRPLDCPRERLPVLVELEVDDDLYYRASLTPTGLSSDGPARVYQRFPVPAGRHRIVVKIRDSARSDGFDYTHEGEIELAPAQNFVIDFKEEAGGIILR